ncbi:hypothetical protein HPB48_019555 [Haemaphysalis longicornis]|uniref:BHLH domain-containing protein n=1 Tax=Haemaphysalis longicornis TaxID=44386 RepID=A0A9J6FPT2_HAELO|nr:hypothetical protein HPB48_019555 [Haemaphysalis longicornis]
MTMKAQSEQQQVISRCLAKVAEGRVGRNGRRERDLNHEEMQSLLAKLKDLVPNMPRNKKLFQARDHPERIDYILDLQIALETHPATRSALPAGSSSNESSEATPGPAITLRQRRRNTCLARRVRVASLSARFLFHLVYRLPPDFAHTKSRP